VIASLTELSVSKRVQYQNNYIISIKKILRSLIIVGVEVMWGAKFLGGNSEKCQMFIPSSSFITFTPVFDKFL
jgi:hypothetical protein